MSHWGNRRGNGNFRGSSRGGNIWRGGRGGASGKQPDSHKVCRFYQQNGSCKFGAACKFSHDIAPGREKRGREEETPTQLQARSDYNDWKRFLKSPPRSNDDKTALQLWIGALEILEGDEREWKQMLPRDIDSEDNYGPLHLKNIMNMRTRLTDYHTFIEIALAFLQTITHPAILDCLSVDTFVGSLYNFITGASGTRAIPFFQHLCETVVKAYQDDIAPTLATIAEQSIIAMSLALREILRRESRARFNEDLPCLIDTIENVAQMIIGDQSKTCTIVIRHVEEMRVVVDRANGLLVREDEVQDLLQPRAATSSYPRSIEMPSNRHDNDKADISQMEIFPTREEILTDIPEFLPSTDKDQPHFLTDPVQRHIDTNFRLLRYDTFGELKNALGNLMHAIEADPTSLKNPSLSFGGFRAYHYINSYISYLSFDQRRGLEANLSFPQLQNLRGKLSSERRKWWEDCKRLSEGILLSFITLHEGIIQHIFLTITLRQTDNRKEHSLTNEERQGTITAKLARHNQEDVESIVRLSCDKTRGVLIEFPGVLPATFMPILANLQEMNRLGRLPFKQWILPGRIDPSKRTIKVDIPPPLYARGGFHFSLKPVLKSDALGDGDIHVNPDSAIDDLEMLHELETRTDLDLGQCRALLAALSREFAFIQGPPGTGKSYLGAQLMKVLMECKLRANLGPIVIVCYTNHALDQFLEHLLRIGIRKIVRLGGQSNSTLLEDHNLRKVAQAESKTRSESFLLARSYEALEEESKRIQGSLGRVHSTNRANWKHVQYYLLKKYPRIHEQFRQMDEDGYQVVGRHPFEIWASISHTQVDTGKTEEYASASHGDDALLEKAERDAYSLSKPERDRIRDLWAQEIQDIALDDIFERVKATERNQRRITNIHDEIDRRVLQNTDVIGITTTGLAKRIATLQRVRCKVVICEEAGEVMEPHMISALLPAAEHFIQIGDHEQLRPQINNFSLSLESRQGLLRQLDRSQFERLSVGEPGRLRMPVAQLNVQRRMRPEISRLIRETIYPRLIDHASTTVQLDVVGMRKNVFWFDHDQFEENQRSDMHHKSHSNKWEVNMVHAMVRHIVRQGTYKSSEIAVLTPYTGQLQKLRAAMRNDFEIVLSDRDQEALEKDDLETSEDELSVNGQKDITSQRKVPLEKKKLTDLLRVATVDNFQGEEAKVIIISLVRSNTAKKVGFLKTTNRINVLLSRAQHGMYLFGNADTYSHISMWEKVLDILRASGSVGKALELCCPRHEETPIQVSQPDDFLRLSPEGGCREACPWRLSDCGHMCQARCHSESMHEVFSCPQPCQRLHDPCKHECQKKTCGEDCGRCLIKLDGVELPCGHKKSGVHCYIAQVPKLISCSVQVEKTVSGCNHQVQVPCLKDIASEGYKCPTPCSQLLKCGHPCPGTCGQCKPKAGDAISTHQICRKICGRKMGACNHTCRKPCHEGQDCGTCSAPCEVRCKHSKCTALCHEPCAPCVEICTWSCEHQGPCTMPCSVPCNRLPCDFRCPKNLKCGHQCPGLCGETCPEALCQKCTTKQDSRVDLFELKTYAEIDINETPIVILGCGHFFTAESLDGLIGMTNVYTYNKLGQIEGLADISGSFAGRIPRCPDCQLPVRQYVTQRYNRVINRAVIDELSKRFLVNGQVELRDLEQRLGAIEKELENSRAEITNARQTIDHAAPTIQRMLDAHNRTATAKKIQGRYDASLKLRNDIKSFLRKVADRHQPVQKLHEATIHAMAANRPESLNDAFVSLGVHETVPLVERDRRVILGGRIIQIRTESMILEDKFRIVQAIRNGNADASLPGGSPETLISPFLKSCRIFITESTTANIPRLAVEASLYFATVSRMYKSSGLLQESDKAKATAYVAEAKAFLETALESCKQPFQNADKLGKAVEESIKLLRRSWYEDVTAEELAMIKTAMVSGSRGIATHSGHWYNCANGHPFAIGECGMPMEQASCPECGAPIGGFDHTPVAGVTRAVNMEG